MIRVSKTRVPFRVWAALPAAVVGLVIQEDGKVSTRPRPAFPRGVCTGCGCTETDACIDGSGRGCAWRDKKRTRCTSCPPAKSVAKGRRR